VQFHQGAMKVWPIGLLCRVFLKPLNDHPSSARNNCGFGPQHHLRPQRSVLLST
jgi:hypothetical protein